MTQANCSSLPVITLRDTRIADLDYVLAAERGEEAICNSLEPGRTYSRPKRSELCAFNSRSRDSSWLRYFDGIGRSPPECSVSSDSIAQKGRGYGVATVLKVQRLSFEVYEADRLWLDVKVENNRARSIYEKAGFKTEGILRECLRGDDNYESLIVMSLLRQEYEAQRTVSCAN